jgi:hypothetical protein
MASEVQTIGHELIKTGSLVSFRIVEEEVLTAPDEAEFGMRLLLRFVSEEGEDHQDEDDVAEDTAEGGTFGFMFVLGVLSFAEARPRNMSSVDYHEKAEFTVADFIEGLRFVRGELHFDADAGSRARAASGIYAMQLQYNGRAGNCLGDRAYRADPDSPLSRYVALRGVVNTLRPHRSLHGRQRGATFAALIRVVKSSRTHSVEPTRDRHPEIQSQSR